MRRGERKKAGRRGEPHSGARPAQQRFKAKGAASVKRRLDLIKQGYRPALQRLAQLGREFPIGDIDIIAGVDQSVWRKPRPARRRDCG